MGSPCAARAAAGLIQEEGVSALVSWGCAAGLHPRATAGRLVLPTEVLAGDGAFAVDLDWHQRLVDELHRQMPVEVGALAESPRVADSLQRKQSLFDETGAFAADMESAAIARIAARCGAKFLVVRAVADSARAPVPACAVDAVGANGRVRLARLAAALGARPHDIVPLVRLGAAFHRARRTLGTVARRASRDLGLSHPCLQTPPPAPRGASLAGPGRST